MRTVTLLYLIFLFSSSFVTAQTWQDNFEGTGNITNWAGDNCGIATNFTNPYQTGGNTSATVLRYSDTGGPYANIRFDTSSNLNITDNPVFSIKIYVPSSGITGNQPNQISLKLQNGALPEPWSTQSEIIKPIVLNQWQVITFNFETDTYINLDGNSPNPMYRSDFNRVLFQINGENNTSQVVAYLDDFYYDGSSNGPNFNNLVWSDEFNVNGAVNTTHWFHQTQLPDGFNWYNGELQHYTNRLVNSSVSNGLLSIVAKKEVYTNQGQTKQYTSARLNSKFAFQYGRVEARAKLATGAGTWPAIWMLGKNVIEPGSFWTSTHGTVGWPACGEIDIMEHWGDEQNFVQSAMHTPSSSGNTMNKGGQTIPTVSSAFHIYTLEWTSERMVFSVDNVVHYIYNPAVKNASTWPFNAPQYLLLNVAIEPSISPSFTQTAMEVDYVRVYQESPLAIEETATLSDIVVYPNPVTDFLKVQLNENSIGATAKLYTVLGQELNAYVLLSNENTIDVSNLSKGIYFIKIESETEIKTVTIIKQ